MRIAFFTEGFDPHINGVVVLIKAFQRALEQAGHDVVIFVPEHAQRPEEEEDVVRLPSLIWHKEAYRTLRPFSGVGKKFVEGRFDVIHSHHPLSTGIAAETLARKLGLPLVYTFHTLLPSYSVYAPLPRAWAESILTWILRRHCNKADTITVTTRVMERWLRERGVVSPITLVRPPILFDRPPISVRDEMRRKLGVGPEECLLMFAGRVVPEKQVDFLVRAISRLKGRASFRLAIVGGGNAEKTVRAEIARCGLEGHVIMTGFVNPADMPDFYAAADVFVFPSRSDTLGLVLVEAMMSELPIVAVDEHGPSEVVLDGRTGYLCPFDEEVFAERVLRLVRDEDLRRRMGRAALEWSRQFCMDDVARQLVETYRMAEEHRRRSNGKSPARLYDRGPSVARGRKG